jgi:membrane-associated phospholipid phosphatase
MRGRILLASLLVLSIYALAVRIRPRWVEYFRDWATLAALLAAYKQMGWFAPGVHRYEWEQIWIRWDRALLYQWGLKAAIEAPGPLLAGLLDACYLLVYAVGPFCLVVLYVRGRARMTDRFLTVYALAVLLSYAQFPFWPSEPPRTVFPDLDAPAYVTPARQWALRLLGSQEIHTSVFPSAHVSGAFAAAFAIGRIFPSAAGLRLGLHTYATAVALATIYGRYHYAADAAAGYAVAVAAAACAVWSNEKVDR